jgi:DNA-binding HxlR family transcriptional regulator
MPHRRALIPMNAREDSRSLPAEEGQAGMYSRASLLVRLIMGRWTLKVLVELSERECRYQDLHNALGGISHKVLTDTLRGAERDGLVTRHVDFGRVESAIFYRLTDLGRSLDEPLAALDRWTTSYWDQVEAARQHWAQRSE